MILARHPSPNRHPRLTFPFFFRLAVRIGIAKPFPLNAILPPEEVPLAQLPEIGKTVLRAIMHLQMANVTAARGELLRLAERAPSYDSMTLVWRWHIVSVCEAACVMIDVGQSQQALGVLVPLAAPLLPRLRNQMMLMRQSRPPRTPRRGNTAWSRRRGRGKAS